MKKELGVWFPTIRTGTGTDIFTERLVDGLNRNGIKAEITWLPLRAEYLPWTVKAPSPPKWTTIVHVNTWLPHRFIPKNFPFVATLHHSIHDPELRPYKSSARALYHKYWKAPNERNILNSATQVTAVSKFVANIAKNTLCDVPIQVIYNGIDTSLFHPITKVRDNSKPFRLLYVGGWKTLKGVDLLASIMNKLGSEYELYYTGGNAAEKDKIHMPSNMYDLGLLTQKEVITQMQISDAFLFPTRSEGFGLVAAEAMACGLPVIASNIASLAEIIDEGISGYLCRTNNICDFATKIKSLKTQENIKIFTLNEKFDIKSMINSYQKLYINNCI